MKTVTAKRCDELDCESFFTFAKNLLYGMWLKNEYVECYLTCGNCGMKGEVTRREKEMWADCPCCGVRNVLE